MQIRIKEDIRPFKANEGFYLVNRKNQVIDYFDKERIYQVLGIKINFINNSTDFLCVSSMDGVPEYFPAENFDKIDESLSQFWVYQRFDDDLFISFPEWMEYFRGFPSIFRLVEDELEDVGMSMDEFNSINSYLHWSKILKDESESRATIIEFSR